MENNAAESRAAQWISGQTWPASAGQIIRRIVLEQSLRAHVGHIGSALSIADIIAVLYGGLLKIKSPDDPERDRFILSKGHAVLALYAAFHLRGWITREELDTYCRDDSRLGMHPERTLRGVDFSTGSLGQGLSMGAGAAFAARLQSSPRRVVVLLSDAECNEGLVWETAAFAAHHRLSNLTAVIDINGQQAMGRTSEVLAMPNMASRWRSFGWTCSEVGGHDVASLAALLRGLDGSGGAPQVVLAHTTFGKGVSFMESCVAWHYLPMDDEQYAIALAEVMG